MTVAAGAHATADADRAAATLARGREVVRAEAVALAELEATLGDSFVAACHAIYACKGQLVVAGMGKSGHVGRKIATTFTATGTPAIFLHPAEAAHGDLGGLRRGDVLLVLSNSGNTTELVAVLDYAARQNLCVIGVSSAGSSRLIARSDIGIVLPRVKEACGANVAPTSSTTMQLALGDALAMTVMDLRGIDKAFLRAIHPGGSIGFELTPVRELMHTGSAMPLVDEGADMAEAISVITAGRFGICGVVNKAGALAGIITDGDLRRNFARLGSVTAGAVATRTPRTLSAETLAGASLVFLNANQITAAFVMDGAGGNDGRPVGIIHIHDLLRAGLADGG